MAMTLRRRRLFSLSADVRVPSQAGKPEVSDVTKDSMKISWTIPNTDGGSQILRCIAGRKEHTAVRWLCINKSLKECRFVDETVDKDIEDNYMYRITAKNKSGPSSRSLPTVSQDNLGTIQLNNTKSSYERNRNMAKHVLGLLGMTALVLLAFIWAQDHHKQNNVAGMMTSCILPNGGVLYVQYDPKTKVKHLKKEAVKKYEENILSSKHAQYRLVHDGWNLPDNAMLGDCSVFGNSTVNLKCLMEGGQPKTPICLKNTCLSTSGQYSCAIDSFLELFFFSIYKQLPDFSQLTNNLGPLLSKVLSTCTARDKSITPNDIQEARETTWEWAIQNVATFAGRTMRACIDELFPHITRTDWEKKYFSLTKTFSRHCLRCNYGKEDIREYCPLVPSANLFDVDKSMKSAINTIIGRGEGVGHCSSCGGQSVKCELKDIQLPEYLFVEVPYVPQHGRWDNLCGVRIEQDMTIREQPYKVVGGIRAKPGHFTAIVSRGGLLYEVDDMCPAPVKEGHTLANIFDQGGDVLTTAPGNLLHMIVYKRAANIVSDMITEVSDNDEAANIVSDMITEVSDNDEAANIVSDMITEVSDNDEAANIVSDMITEVSDNHEAANIVSDMDTEVSDNDETRVSLSSVENSATSVWRPWATFSRKLAQTTSQIMPMRRESSTTTRDKENGHLLTQRGKSGALRKEDTPRVHSVVGRTIDWMWRNLRYLIGQHKHSEIPAAVEASHNFERYIKLHMFWNGIIAHCRGYLQRQIYTTKIKNRKQVDQKPSLKKPLENHTFLLSGRVPANCGKKQDLCAMIRENGGRVMDKVPPRGVSVDITVLTTQKEIDKGMDSCKNASRLTSRASRAPQPNDTIIKAFQRKWKILSFQYVLDCIKLTSTLDKYDYFLNLESLQKAPSTCLASIEETLPESLYFGKGRSAITQLRRKMKASKKPKVMKTKRKRTKRLSIWARFVSKESQKLKGHMKRGNCIQNAREISKRWKTLTAEQRRDFTEESRKSFQKRQLEKSINSPKVVHPNRSPAYKTAIAGLSPLMKDCLQKKQLKEKTALAHPQ
ncbi:IGSF22 [Branchiostoma lanceolatum]|uniref:IGSF22 protein n=2 Tax=Branchiostoma lanceolatum TaxID=7740 RepID=A0A8K0AG98_BRALA|nr:IGSF22 [Branchiostoma lanceolatum]